MADLSKLYDALIQGDEKSAVSLVREAIDAKADPEEILNQYMVPAMSEAGRRFECNELFIPELLLVGRAMKNAMEVIRPLLTGKGTQPTGRAVIGTVAGDLHDIGKNLVASMLEGGGFEVVDLGTNVSPASFVTAAKDKGAQIIALSALLTTTMPYMKAVVEELKKAGLRDKVKVIIGGAPVTQEYADQIGADGYSDNANGAVVLAKRLVAA